MQSQVTRPNFLKKQHGNFPWWGYAALIWTGLIWITAWNSSSFIADIRRFSFTPLWLGYIVIVNALTWQRNGYSLLTNRPIYLVKLFFLSAGFWWFFEYLNRFVKNWYYQGIEHYTPVEYFITATFPFATVLPAVISTYLLLYTYPQLWWGLDNNWHLRVVRPRLWGLFALFCGISGLMMIAIFPLQLYPLVWVAPLILVTAIQAVSGRHTIYRGVSADHNVSQSL